MLPVKTVNKMGSGAYARRFKLLMICFFHELSSFWLFFFICVQLLNKYLLWLGCSDPMRSALTIFILIAFGFFIGKSFPSLSISKVLHFSFPASNFLRIHLFILIRYCYWNSQLSLTSSILPSVEVSCPKHEVEVIKDQPKLSSLVSNEIHNSSANRPQGHVIS